MRWERTSIVRRLVVLTLAAGLVTGLVGVAVVTTVARQDLRDEAMAHNHGAADRIATVVDGRLGALHSQLRLLASREAIVSFQDAQIELAVALRVSDDLDALVLHDRRGHPVAASSSSRLLDVEELAPRPELIGALEGAGPQVRVIRGSHPSPADGATDPPLFELAVPVENPPGTVVGALVGWAPIALVVQSTETGDLGEGSEAFLVGSDGTIIAHRQLELVLAAERYPTEEVFEGGREVTVVRSGGEPVLVAGAPLATTPGWVVVEQPEAAAVARLGSTASEVTGVFLAVVAAIVVAVVLAGHRLLRPLRPLAVAVDRLGRGELGVRVEEGAPGEAGVLAAGFNRMAAALQARQVDLEDAERAARRSEERLRLMVEGVEDYAIVLLGPEGRVRSWNTGARRLLGTDADDAMDRPFTSFLDPNDPPGDPLAAAATDGRGDVEGWCRRDDGRRFWARIVATALHDEAREHYGYAVVLHDLTVRHAAEEATATALERERQAASELRRANELKDEFLAIAAHEIRTPLSAILGASRVLSDDWDELEDDERRRFRDIIETHAQDMRGIVERLLDLSRLQAGRIRIAVEQVQLDEALRQHVRLVAPDLDGHEVSIDAPPTVVAVDPQALRHIVTNLLSNAAKFSPAGSPVTVSARVEGDLVTIEVADRGVGIAAEDQAHIFEMFHRSNGNAEARGTGIGLAIVRRYAQLAGGDVEVDSAPGEGSTFRVMLRSGHRA